MKQTWTDVSMLIQASKATKNTQQLGTTKEKEKTKKESLPSVLRKKKKKDREEISYFL